MANLSPATELMLLGHPISRIFYDVGIQIIAEVFKLLFIAVVVVLMWGTARYYWERWRRKDTRNVSFTVNYIDKDNTLLIRPIGRQIPVEYLFPDPVMRRAFVASSKRTGQVPKYPIMEFSDSTMRHEIMSHLRSWITDEFKEGYMMAAAGLPTVRKRFVVMPVYEQYPLMTREQIRVVATEIHQIEGLQPEPDTVKFESPKHRYRLSTIAEIANFWRFCDPDDRRDFVVDIEFPKSCFE